MSKYIIWRSGIDQLTTSVVWWFEGDRSWSNRRL